MSFRSVLVSSVFVAAVLAQGDFIHAEDTVKEGFEGRDVQKDINPRFKVCPRPENWFQLSADKSKTGKQSLQLSITPPIGVAARKLWDLNPKNCLLENKEGIYEGDKFERAEIWEDKNQNPKFGEGEAMFYGFSMWVDAAAAPKGDFNRFVLAQWKAGCTSECDISPFLAQRLTGGFYHITLDVDAYEPGGLEGPTACKVLLAFAADQPAPDQPPLALDRPVQCEPRLDFPPSPMSERKIVEKIEIKRERYLPSPFDTWTDLVFRVDGGKDNGVIQVWAGGQLIATATGWIGHRISLGTKQYFKFGPYRNTTNYGATVYLDNLARGSSYEEVDPSKF